MKRFVLSLVALLALTVVAIAPAGAAVALTQRPLVSPDSRPYDYFGRSVDVSGTTAIVGAFHNHDHGSPGEVGAAYVYVRSGKSWKLQQKLKAPDGQDGDWFGTWVSISGSTAAVAAPTAGRCTSSCAPAPPGSCSRRCTSRPRRTSTAGAVRCRCRDRRSLSPTGRP